MREKAHPDLKQALRPVKRRVHLSNAIWYGSVGVLIAGASCAVFVGASYFIPVPQLSLLTAAAASSIFTLAVLAGLLKPVSYGLAARRADDGGLAERALTALTLFENTPMALLQRDDAVRHLKSLPLKTAIPLKLSKHSLLAASAITLFLMGALFFIPNPQNDVLLKRESFQKAMAEQAKTVEEEAEKLEESPYTKEELNKLRKLMGDLARELRDSKEPQQAFLAMDKAQRKLEDLQKNTSDKARTDAAQAFAQSGLKDMSQALSKSDAKASAKAVEQLESPGSQTTSSAALEKASDAMPEGALKEAAAQTAQALKSGDAKSVSAALTALSSAMQSTCSGSSPGDPGDLSTLMGQLRAGTLTASQAITGQAAGAGQGKGNGSGQGTGTGQGQQGNAGGGAGKGSTNLDGGITKPGTSSMGEGTNPSEYKLGQYETIYDPTRLSGADDIHKTTGVMGEGESQQVQLGPGLGDATGQVPYQDVILNYQDAASKAAQQAELPEGMRLWVDGYFQALID